MLVGYLRPGEIIRKVRDVVRPADSVSGPIRFCVIKLHAHEDLVTSKTHEFHESVSFDLSYSLWIGAALMAHVNGRRIDDKLFAMTLLDLHFTKPVATAGMGYMEPQLYQLRHGEISHDVAHRLRSLQKWKW